MSTIHQRICVRIATDGLYSAFAEYSICGAVDSPMRPVNKQRDRRFQLVPLASLEASDLNDFVYRALTTEGDLFTFKYLLPRILDLALFDAAWNIEREIVFGKLRIAEWATWPRNERKAVHDAILVMWQGGWREYPSPFGLTLSDMLCCLGQVYNDLDEFLNDLSAPLFNGAIGHLLDFAEENAAQDDALVLSNPWWRNRQLQAEQVSNWWASSGKGLLRRVVVDAHKLSLRAEEFLK